MILKMLQCSYYKPYHMEGRSPRFYCSREKHNLNFGHQAFDLSQALKSSAEFLHESVFEGNGTKHVLPLWALILGPNPSLQGSFH